MDTEEIITIGYMEIIEEEEKVDLSILNQEEQCPICGNTDLVKAGRCSTCYACGWSKCSL